MSLPASAPRTHYATRKAPLNRHWHANNGDAVPRGTAPEGASPHTPGTSIPGIAQELHSLRCQPRRHLTHGHRARLATIT